MQKYKLIINAPFINTGGGKVLLDKLLKNITPSKKILVILDRRLKYDNEISHVKILQSSKNPFNYFLNELYLFFHSSHQTRVICLHNLPVFFKNPGFVSVYLHNKLYLSRKNSFFSLGKIKNYFFTKSLFFCDEIIVQTPAMKNELQTFLENKFINKPIEQLPFFDTKDLILRKMPIKYDFIYVADGSLHKNHQNLLKAWIILAQENIRPSIVLTLGISDNLLLEEIDAKSKIYNLKIYNFSNLGRSDINNLYCSSKALIFPSFVESFGLPLLEATFHKLKILAPELDYVRDVCNPDFTFDPTSPFSIASSVKRSLNIPNVKLEIFSPEYFLRFVSSKRK